MELRTYLAALRKYWWLILLLTVVSGAVAAAYSTTVPTNYRATARTFVTVDAGNTTAELVQGSTFVQNSIQSFVQLAKQPIVLDPVIAELELDRTARSLAGSVSSTNPLNTYFIDVTVTDGDAQRAADVANAVVDELAQSVVALSPTGADGTSFVHLTTVSPAIPPAYPFEPHKKMIAATGAAVGVVLGVLVALGLALLDTRVRTAPELQRIARLPVLATVPRSRSADGAATTVETDPRSPRAESYRRLQANLQYLDADAPKRVVVISSSIVSEGKSSTAINLVLAMAEKKLRVLLIDADLRRPSVSQRLGLPGEAGLTTVLIGKASLEDVVQPYAAGVDVLTSGELPPNPAQLLDSDAMSRLVDTARSKYEMVVIDAPPVLPVIDASLLARRADGMIFVTAVGRLKRADLQRAVHSVEAVGSNLLGLVAIVPPSQSGTTYYRYEERKPTLDRPRRSQLRRPGS